MEELDLLLEQHRRLREAMPRTWNAFFAAFRELRPVQLTAMGPILAGTSALVTAPTAGGKTEAVMAPLCERLLRNRWNGLSILLITPTRALVNDLYIRLYSPLEQLRVQLGRKTSDHGVGDDIAAQVLVTTPESTESLLMLRREELNFVQAIVLDEIHLLDGSPRGDHLRAVLARLSAYRKFVGGAGFAGLQRVAMSATVADPLRLAACYLGDHATIISVSGQRELESKIIRAAGTDKDRAHAAIDAADAFADIRKMLVFVNSRKQVDSAAGFFRFGRFAKVPVHGHHGSLSKSKREEAEERFKADEEAICVATMTLEVGIDIGDIDLVVCMDPPFSLSSFLQRIGRGCRRLKGRTRVLCIARDRASELMFDALVWQAGRGMPAGPTPPFRRSVLLQQVLAYLRQAPKNHRTRTQFLETFSSPVPPPIDADLIGEVLCDMVQTGMLDQHGSIYQPAADGWSFIQSNAIFTNIQPNPVEITLIDADTGQSVASVAGLHGSKGVRLAGRSFELLPGGGPHQHRVRAGGEHQDSPKYHARTLPYAFDIGAALAAYLRIEPDTLVVVDVGESAIIFTWLGRLLNSILAKSLNRCGYAVEAGSFHLKAPRNSCGKPIELLRDGVAHSLADSPLGELPVDRIVDLGPHYRHLSDSMQRKAHEDWLDRDFLGTWIERIRSVRTISHESESAADLLELI
ncbi:MAG: DEAD/DEAH box helicase [Planctomycetaceae bacterium]